MKKTERFKKFTFWGMIALTILCGLPLLLTFFAGMVPPSVSKVVFLLTLGFKYVFVANVVIAVLWFFVDYRYALISVLLILLNTNTIDKYFQFQGSDVPEKLPNSIKIVSYNARLFGLYKDDDMDKRRGDKAIIMQFLKEERPDIVCFQEYFWDKSESLNFHTTDEVLSVLEMEENDEHYYQYFTDTAQGKFFYGLAIFSRYRILHAEPVITDYSSNAIIYIDIKYKGDTIRVYNAHLASLHLSVSDYATSQQLASNNPKDPMFQENTKRLLKKLTSAANRRQKQVDILRAHMDSCHYPIILCGDFNDPPSSYSYNRLAHSMKDSFRESGRGFGYTYQGDHMPHYRIDYILHDKRYHSFGHTVQTQIPVSDHFPILTTLSLQKKE